MAMSDNPLIWHDSEFMNMQLCRWRIGAVHPAGVDRSQRGRGGPVPVRAVHVRARARARAARPPRAGPHGNAQRHTRRYTDKRA